MMGRKTTLAFANMAVGILLGLVSAKLVALYMQTGPLGQLTGAMGFLGLLYFVTDLGMGQAHVKRVSEGRDPGDCFATFAAFKIVATLAFVVLATAGLWTYLVLLGKPLESTTLPILVVVIGYFVAKSLQEIGQSSFDARLETARSQLTSFTDTVVRIGLTIFAALAFAALAFGTAPLAGRVPSWLAWIRDEPGLALAVATAGGAVAAAAVSLTLLARVPERGRFRWELLKDYWSFAIPLFLTSAVGIIAQSIDASSLAFFYGDEEAGLFGGIRRIVSVLGGVAVPVGLLLFPAMSSLVAQGDHARIQRTMDRSIRYLSMLVVPMCVFVAVFSEPIIRLFLSDAFVSAAPALSVFCGYVVLSTLATPHANLILGAGRSDVGARIGFGVAATVILLNLVLVPRDIKSLGVTLAGLGVMGTALATLASGVVYYVGVRVATARLLGYRERAGVWKHFLAAGAMGAALAAVHLWVFPFHRWFDAALFVPLGGVVYFLALLALRELTWDDWRFLKESVHPIEMLRYMRDELLPKRRRQG